MQKKTIWAGSGQNSPFRKQPSPASKARCICAAGRPSRSVRKSRDVVRGMLGQSSTLFFQHLGEENKNEVSGHQAGCTNSSTGESSTCTTKALLFLGSSSARYNTRYFQETAAHLAINQHLIHTDIGQLPAKRVRVPRREVAWSTGSLLRAGQHQDPAFAAEIYRASGRQREPPPGQKQNCSSKLFHEHSPSRKKHNCTSYSQENVSAAGKRKKTQTVGRREQ